jgi:hypothetical protein
MDSTVQTTTEIKPDTCLTTLYAKGNDEVNEDEMGRACSTNGGEEECI